MLTSGLHFLVPLLLKHAGRVTVADPIWLKILHNVVQHKALQVRRLHVCFWFVFFFMQ